MPYKAWYAWSVCMWLWHISFILFTPSTYKILFLSLIALFLIKCLLFLFDACNYCFVCHKSCHMLFPFCIYFYTPIQKTTILYVILLIQKRGCCKIALLIQKPVAFWGDSTHKTAGFLFFSKFLYASCCRHFILQQLLSFFWQPIFYIDKWPVYCLNFLWKAMLQTVFLLVNIFSFHNESFFPLPASAPLHILPIPWLFQPPTEMLQWYF